MSALRDFFLFEQAIVHRQRVSGDAARPRLLDRVVEGLTDDQLRCRPHPKLNSMVWSIWHIARCEDVGLTAMVLGEQQELDSGGWHKRLGIQRRDIATGMNDSEVSDFSEKVDIPALLDYSDAVGRRTREIVQEVSDADWSEVPDQARLKQLIDQGTFGRGAEFVIDNFSEKPRWFFLRLATTHSLGHLYEASSVRTLVTGRTL